MKGRNFPSQNQTGMIYEDLREFHRRTQYFTHGDRCFGHPPVIRCLPDEIVCRILSQGTCVFPLFYKTQQNVISLLGRKPIT